MPKSKLQNVSLMSVSSMQNALMRLTVTLKKTTERLLIASAGAGSISAESKGMTC